MGAVVLVSRSMKDAIAIGVLCLAIRYEQEMRWEPSVDCVVLVVPLGCSLEGEIRHI